MLATHNNCVSIIVNNTFGIVYNNRYTKEKKKEDKKHNM